MHSLVHEGVVAVRRGARHDGALFFTTFTHAWPVEQAVPFNKLLHEIDEAEGELRSAGRPERR